MGAAKALIGPVMSVNPTPAVDEYSVSVLVYFIDNERGAGQAEEIVCTMKPNLLGQLELDLVDKILLRAPERDFDLASTDIVLLNSANIVRATSI